MTPTGKPSEMYSSSEFGPQEIRGKMPSVLSLIVTLLLYRDLAFLPNIHQDIKELELLKCDNYGDLFRIYNWETDRE